jgi:hypothetical protein
MSSADAEYIGKEVERENKNMDEMGLTLSVGVQQQIMTKIDYSSTEIYQQ